MSENNTNPEAKAGAFFISITMLSITEAVSRLAELDRDVLRAGAELMQDTADEVGAPGAGRMAYALLELVDAFAEADAALTAAREAGTFVIDGIA